jgi:ATP-dependent helicase/nuclease subunit A
LDEITHQVEDDYLAASPVTVDPKVRRLVSPQSAAVSKQPDTETEGPMTDVPDWVRRPPAPEPTPPRPLAPSRPRSAEATVQSPVAAAQSGTDGPDRYRRGRLLHALLQHLPNVAPDMRGAAADRYLDAMASDLDVAARRELAAEVTNIIDHPDLSGLFGPRSFAEVPLTGRVRAVGSDGDREVIVSGQIDRMVVDENRVLVVDFKSDRPPPETVEEIPRLYLEQLAAYRALLTEIYPEKTIDCALLWTLGPRWMPIDSERLDTTAFALTI